MRSGLIKAVKKAKEKACKHCKTKYIQKHSFITWCSPDCGYKLSLKKQKEKEKKEYAKWKEHKQQVIEEQELEKKPDVEKTLEREVNTIVRLIDKGWPCISSGATKYIVNAGHLRSVKAFPELRYHLLNIFAQRVHDNQYIGGNPIEYREGLKRTFGFEVYEEIECLPAKYKILDLEIHELKEKIKEARKIVRELKKQVEGIERPFTIEERIIRRREINQTLGIYE